MKRKGNAGENQARDALRALGCECYVTAPNRGLCHGFDDLVAWHPSRTPWTTWARGRDADPNALHIEVKYGSSYSAGKLYNAHERYDRSLGAYAADPHESTYTLEAVLWSRVGMMTGSIGAWLEWCVAQDAGALDVAEVDYVMSERVRRDTPRDGALFARHPRKPWVVVWWVYPAA